MDLTSSQIITIEQQKEIFAQFTSIVNTLDEDILSDSENKKVKAAKKKAKPYSQALFFGSHFNIHLDKPEFGNFNITPPQPFSYDSFWEDWVEKELQVFGASWEYSHFYCDEHLPHDKPAQIKRYLALFQTLLALGSTPEPSSFGYEEWLAHVPKIEDKPQFEKQVRMNSYHYDKYLEKLEQQKNETLAAYTKEHERYGYCPWGQKAEVSKQLEHIVKNTLVLNLQDAQIRDIFTHGDMAQVSDIIKTFKEQEFLQKGIEETNSYHNENAHKSKNSKTNARKI